MLARMPPTLRWPLRPSSLAAVACLMNSASVSASPVTKVTFIFERLSASAVALNSELISR